MGKRVKHRKWFMVITLFVMGMFLVSCGALGVKPTSEMDDPRHHTDAGIKFLNAGNINEAQNSFARAIALDPKFSMALAGMGLVKACQGNFEESWKLIEKANFHRSTKEEQVFSYVSYVRFYTMSKSRADWLDRAYEQYSYAVDTDSRVGLPHYWMGIAYKEAFEWNKAEGMFSKVMDLKADLTAEAKSQMELIQKIKLAMPGTATGKKIALVGKLTRADAAALFMEELKIDKLYEKRTVKTYDTGFKDPITAKKKRGVKTASDIAANPLRSDIEAIIRIGVRGLEVNADGTFDPAGLVNRGPYAMMIEDILIKVTGDEKLATKFIGSTSTFPDLRSDLPYFNAVMVVTSRGIMKGDLATGQFNPEGPVSGVDALLIIKDFRDQLNFR